MDGQIKRGRRRYMVDKMPVGTPVKATDGAEYQSGTILYALSPRSRSRDLVQNSSRRRHSVPIETLIDGAPHPPSGTAANFRAGRRSSAPQLSISSVQARKLLDAALEQLADQKSKEEKMLNLQSSNSETPSSALHAAGYSSDQSVGISFGFARPTVSLCWRELSSMECHKFWLFVHQFFRDICRLQEAAEVAVAGVAAHLQRSGPSRVP